MQFRMVHNNLNVYDLEKSLKFYADALDLHEARRINADDGSFIIVYLEDGSSSYQLELTWMREMTRPYDLGDNEFHLAFKVGNSVHQLELTWLRDRTEPYDLGEDEFHLAFRVDDYEGAHALHESMGCICYENPKMGIYFISDPDGYWIEVVPEK